jgi:hypothetical protein
MAKSMATYILSACVFMLTMHDQSTGTEVIARINYGVYFRETAQLKVHTQYWNHIFQLQVPVFDQPSPSIQPCDAKRFNADYCSGHKTADTIIRRTYHTIQQMFMDNKKIVLAVLPEHDEDWTNITKRTILTEIGEFAGKIFGLASASDVNVLRTAINAINENEQDAAEAINDQKDLMASYMNVSNHRFDSLVTAIKTDHNLVTQVAEGFDSRVNSVMRWVHALMILNSKQTRLLTKLEQTLTQFGMATEMLSQGQITPHLIPVAAMQQAVQEIAAHLIEDGDISDIKASIGKLL